SPYTTLFRSVWTAAMPRRMASASSCCLPGLGWNTAVTTTVMGSPRVGTMRIAPILPSRGERGHRVPPGRAGSALGRRGPRRLRGVLAVDRTLEQQDRLVGRLAVRLRQEAVHEERAAQAQHGEDDHHP